MNAERVLVATAAYARRHARLVFALGLILALASGAIAARRLGVTTDTDRLFAASLPWRQREIAFERDFPQFQNLLVAVIDAAEPEEADATAAGLAAALGHTASIQTVQRPDASPYFAREGLLFLDQKALGALLDQTIDAQPFIGQLAADPSARGLFAALALLGMGVTQGQADLTPYLPELRQFDAALAPNAPPLSWESLLAGGLAQQAGRYRFVLVQPKLDFSALQPGGAATAAIRAAAAGLPFVRAGAAHVRITGAVALADEEFASAAKGVLAGTLASLVLITLWLVLAVRSWRLIVPMLLTLFLGLALTSGFAALAVGTLNLVSVAFALLFVGIAVDFAIQFSVRFREARLILPAPGMALGETARRAGGQILVAAAATAAGFYAFVPTAFDGVAELGLIAGSGMLIAFLCTMTFLPAAIALFAPPGEAAEVGFRHGRAIEAALLRRRGAVLLGFAALALLGLLLLPGLRFDSDPLHTKNPHTEAMRTLRDLMDDPLTNPYSIDILRPSMAAAQALAARLASLPLVAQVLTLDSFVPQDQAAKLALVADAANILQATLAPRPPAAPVSAADLRLAIGAALAQIEPALPKLPPGHPLAAIAADLRALRTAPDARLLAMNAALTQFLPLALDRLRTALTAQPVGRADVPPEIARDWLLPDGAARIQVLSKPAARDSAGLHAFVAEVSALAPDAGGSAVTIVATAGTIIGAFRAAAMAAIVAIAVILFLALRRPRDVALVMAPLLLSALLTVLAARILGMSLNFANIIALPLLLGVGVSFNIYFVMNWRAGRRGCLGSATARAVVFSALTTGTAFGSLALSYHPGTASMGVLLLLSLGCTLLASLVFMPALLGGLTPPPGPRGAP